MLIEDGNIPGDMAAHDGEKIRQLLAMTGKTPADLARACGVSRTAVDRYLKSDTIGKLAWLTVRVGLLKIGIDPRKVKPEDMIVDTGDTDLRPLVQGFDRDTLERIRKIIEAEPAAREKLVYYIDGILLTMRARK